MTTACIPKCFVRVYSVQRLLSIIYLKIILFGHGISHLNQTKIGNRLIIFYSFSYFLNRLIQIWESMFSIQLLDVLSMKQCPMIIGVMRRSAGEKGWSIISDYQSKLLVNGDKLILTREIFLQELITFKEECDDNEQILVSR